MYTCCGSWVLVLLQEGRPLPGLGSGLLSNTQKWVVQGDTCTDNAKDFIGKESQADSSRVREPRRTAETALVAVSGFMVMGLVSELSLANHSDSESFLVVHTLLHQDRSQREGFWEVVGHAVSPFNLSWTPPIGGGLLVPCSLPGHRVVKQLMQVVTMVSGQGGWFQSVYFP